jgi:hypothetical protein
MECVEAVGHKHWNKRVRKVTALLGAQGAANRIRFFFARLGLR